MNVLTYIPAKARQYIYLSYSGVGIVMGAILAGYGSLQMVTPDWLVVAQAVYGYVGTATNIVAASNVTPEAEPEGDGDGDVTDAG